MCYFRVAVNIVNKSRTDFGSPIEIWHSGSCVVIAPTIQLDKYNFLTEKLDLFLHYTAHFTSEGVADFFYRVDPQFQNSERIAYEGNAGFLSHEVSLALKYRFTNKNLIIGTQYSDFSQSANTQSYLHRSNTNWSYVLAFAWILHESSPRGIR